MSATCVFCRRQPVDPHWRPFCSERCKIQDLARWADGSYRVPVREPDSGSEESERRADESRTPGKTTPFTRCSPDG